MSKYPITYREICGLWVGRMITPGSKIWFRGEKHGYTVRASNVAFSVLTKPFNARKTTLYTIIDWESGVRGPENLIFGMGAETDSDCQEMLNRLTQFESEVSSRNFIDLDIVKFQLPEDDKIYTKESNHDN